MIINGRIHNASTYTNHGCRCDVCVAGMSEMNRRQRAKRFATTRESGLPAYVRHGANAYRNWGCRCEVCTAAATVDGTERAKRRGYKSRQTPAERSSDKAARKRNTAMYGVPDGVEHGVGTYSYWGCRCAVCRRATARAKARERAARKAAA